ncbi:MAG: nitrous oxide reductase accessory protein NosL [Balneolaceae bacterium]
MNFKVTYFPAVLIILLLITGCEPKPKPIQYGHEDCSYCRMMITEPQYGAQTLNKQGRSFTFDSIECMAAFAQENVKAEQIDVHSHWIADFTGSEEFIRAEEAHYLHSENLRSPMGLNLSAHATLEQAEKYRGEYGGEILNWAEVKEFVHDTWLDHNNGNAIHTRDHNK